MLLSSWFLWLGARWARIPNVTFGRALAAMALGALATIACRVVLVASDIANREPILALAIAIGQLVLAWVIIQKLFRTSFGRAILAWLPTLAGAVVAVALAAFVVKPYLLETYEIPTGGMAPTVAGEHFELPCPHCEGTLFVSAAETLGVSERLGICDKCFRMSMARLPESEPLTGDRIVALRFLEPRRWDVIVLQFPEDPSVLRVERVVGMPGEEVAIRDGGLLINGEHLPMPARIAGLTYIADPTNESRVEWGPVRLGDDEYFVLGDFTRHSADARVWRKGAPGHPPYALPKDHIVGVVTHIYWPVPRWRVFR